MKIERGLGLYTGRRAGPPICNIIDQKNMNRISINTKEGRLSRLPIMGLG